MIEGWRSYYVSPPGTRYELGEQEGVTVPPYLKGRRARWYGPELQAECLMYEAESTAGLYGAMMGAYADLKYVYETEGERQRRCIMHMTGEEPDAHLDGYDCGIYIVPTLKLLSELFTHDGMSAWVLCSGWGMAAEHEKGWRCQFVRMQEIYLPSKYEPFVEALSDVYEVPVRTREELV